jgi:hypothetical protein
MYRILIRQNITYISIFLFLVIFGVLQMLKPAFLYNKDGSVREFGIGYRNKTICPVWLFAILLGTLCYLFVLYILYTM